MDIPQILVAVGSVLGSGGIIAAVVTALAGRGKARADAAASLTTTATGLLGPLREEVDTLRRLRDEDREEFRREIAEMRQRVDDIESELRDERDRNWSLVGYARRLIDSHRRHAPGVPIPAPTTDIVDIIDRKETP